MVQEFSPILQFTDSASPLEELDKLAAQVEESERSKGRLFPICLLGQAGVSKSTLVNTRIASTDVVITSGGGTVPLTANALRATHGAYFRRGQLFISVEHGHLKRFVAATCFG